jgi:hypothetical protein
MNDFLFSASLTCIVVFSVDFNTRSFRSVVLFLNGIPLEEGGGGTRFYATEALKHLKQNEKGQWTCDKESLNELVTVEVPAEVGKLTTFDQTLVHEVTEYFYC